jgi:hypothetical protein
LDFGAGEVCALSALCAISPYINHPSYEGL